MTPLVAEPVLAVSKTEHRTISLALFAVFVAITLFITIWASRQNKTAADYYAGGRQFSALQNGLAIGGDYMSAASFLGIAGLFALSGYDGFLYSIGFLVAWLVALLLVAELLRNSGRYTMADVLAYRMRQRPVRAAAGVSTIVVSIFYLLAQMVGAGALVSLLLGTDSEATKIWTIVVVGALMIFYVTVGGMKGTTWVQIVKAVMLMVGAIVMTIWVLSKYSFNLSSLLHAAAEKSGKGDAFLKPGLKYGATDMWSKLDLLSLGLALVLGTAGLPHILIRFYTVPTAKAARKSVNWAIGIIGAFYLMTLVIGFGAAALVGSAAIKAANPGGNTAAPQLAEELGGGAGSTGGAVFLAIIAAVAFATILAVVAGLTLASSSSFAHDIYANVFKRGKATEKDEVKQARIAAIVIGAIAIVLSIFARGLNVAFLVALAFAIAASANLPNLLFSLFWKRFNTRGALWGIYAGLITAVGLVLLSPVAWGGASDTKPPAKLTAKTAKDCGVPVTSKEVGNPDALFSCTTKAPFPMENPGLVSIPVGFIAAALGAMSGGRRPEDDDKYAELEVRSLTGMGAA
ncbi:cation acetate symporter [Actinomadura barringtoniae]|uniref:Cation acetate symporter n=1 Tax=Actinomadura barringtoniae TaxID=1427535 RepID=A0A939PN50_9ACTN|nr:cation acetate symporter [Actinomadura barringtoniae]MBO2453123.1 cation acetate symporter [Actinomadura barringtoniae]